MRYYQLIESSELENDLQKLIAFGKDRGAHTFDIYSDPSRNAIKLSSIIIPKSVQKQGIGSLIMKELTSVADKHHKVIWLELATKDDNFGTTSTSRLITFYRRFGFVRNSGRNKDFRFFGGMYRNPK